MTDGHKKGGLKLMSIVHTMKDSCLKIKKRKNV